ncbi:hypothetical protein BV22DRAFT_1130759 [Leucogyrophana mollusca]|uniref:Uncharacterized protein n=1 Tax=Leucogyrophana mollusca TaxID=85980 RepID=A0ACB8BCU5_9AGAM|nr:hypothetical protein BV22DRAFT_1130759 [Leucogyrophana mollusca]
MAITVALEWEGVSVHDGKPQIKYWQQPEEYISVHISDMKHTMCQLMFMEAIGLLSATLASPLPFLGAVLFVSTWTRSFITATLIFAVTLLDRIKRRSRQDEKRRERCRAHAESLERNPFVPPQGGECFVHRLPHELLSYIFELCVCDEAGEEKGLNFEEEDLQDRWQATYGVDNTDEIESLDGTDGVVHDIPSFDLGLKPQIVVSSVCTRWRSIALATHSLWACLKISCRESPPFDRVETWISRTGAVPLDIDIDCDPSSPELMFLEDEEPIPISSQDLTDLLDILLPHLHRWRSFKLSVLHYEDMLPALTVLTNPLLRPAAQLKTFQLGMQHIYSDYNTWEIMSPDLFRHNILAGGAPRLQNIHLVGVHMNWAQSWFTSCTNLVELDLRSHATSVRPSWSEFAQVLRGSPALQTMKLFRSGPTGNPKAWPKDDVVECRTLKNLEIEYLSPSFCTGLFRRLVLPGLTSLSFAFDDDGEIACDNLIRQLAGPAFRMEETAEGETTPSLLSQLRHLTVDTMPCQSSSVIVMYGGLLHLETLVLGPDLIALNPAWFNRLTSHNGTVFLPSLTSLTTAGVSAKNLRTIVSKRRNAKVPLKTVHMHRGDEVSIEDAKWLRKYLDTFEVDGWAAEYFPTFTGAIPAHALF